MPETEPTIYEQIDNIIMDDSMRFQCSHCGNVLGYMSRSLFGRISNEDDWIICANCFGRIDKK